MVLLLAPPKPSHSNSPVNFFTPTIDSDLFNIDLPSNQNHHPTTETKNRPTLNPLEAFTVTPQLDSSIEAEYRMSQIDRINLT